jgi:hypothetical protein
MIAATGPHRPSLPALVNPGNTNRATASSQFAPTDLAISPMFSAKYGLFTRSLSLFATATLYFHQLTDSFRKNRGWGVCTAKNQITSLLFQPKKGKTPDRLGGGNPGLGG